MSKGKVSDLKKQGESFIEDAEDVKKEIEDRLNEKKETVSKEVMNKMSDTLEKIETIQTQGVKMTQDVRKKFFKKNGKILS
jgi:hypothetical protein